MSSSSSVSASLHTNNSNGLSASQKKDWLNKHKGVSMSFISDDSKLEFVIDETDDLDDWIVESEEETPINGEDREKSVEIVTSKDTLSSTNVENGQVITVNSSFEVVFETSPMGFTLGKSRSGKTHVTKIAPGGRASQTPMSLGDSIVEINGIPLSGYDEFIKSLPGIQYPARFLMQRHANPLQHTPVESSLVPDNNILLNDAYKEFMLSGEGKVIDNDLSTGFSSNVYRDICYDEVH